MLVERHTQGGKREKQRVEESDREAERGRERESGREHFIIRRRSIRMF